METTPFRTNGIDNPKFLFGRQEELKNLCDYAEGLHQVEIIGARRFGKTCLVKCFIMQYKDNPNRKAYPVYLDPYTDGIRGTASVYCYITAKIITNLYADGYIYETALNLDDYKITPNKKWEKVYKQLENIRDEIDQICIFDETVETFSKKMGQKFLLIFDEYEKAIDAFDKIDGLLHIRELSGKSSNPIIFWIVGASKWKKFIEGSNKDVRGSGVFNGVTQNQPVCPLGFSDFSEMWKYECSMITDDTKRLALESIMKRVYSSSGGIPCYAKEIGATAFIEGEYPQYNRLSNHFAEIEKNLTDGDIKCLRSLLTSPVEYASSEIPTSIIELEYLGLIKNNGHNRYYIPCSFYADYIKADINENFISDAEESTIDTTIKDIIKTFYAINEKSKCEYGKYMFDSSNDTGILYESLRTKCDSREKAPNLVNSIYLLYWEGAKENGVAGNKLPVFFKDSIFRKAMDRIRHVLGLAHQQDKLDTKHGQIDKATALQVITGNSIEPQNPTDWLLFQKCMLNLFLQELKNLYDSIGKELRDGKEFEGRIVEVKGTAGKTYINVHYKYCSYPLRPQKSNLTKLSNGDIVRFIARERQDISNPLKTYWMAYNIKLKK